VHIDADKLTRAPNGNFVATGHVIIKRTSETLIADKVVYLRKNHIMEASGNVIIRSASATIYANAVQLQSQSKTGTMKHATIILPNGERLRAERVKRIDDQRFEADHITFSSCPSDDESWRIAANHALLDQENGSLTVTNPRFELGKTPVFYAPWWKLSLRRKSGLLMPLFNQTTRRGTELGIPIYFAPSKSWDLTLTPHWMSKRGVMGEAELRHVSAIGHERLRVAGINDTFAGRVRGRIRANILWKLPANARITIRADHVSDHNYLVDFGGTKRISSRYLRSVATLSQHLQIANTQTDSFLQAQDLQNLLLSSNASTLQILPRLQSSSQWQPHRNIIFHFDQQTTRFNRSSGVDGWRMDLHPYIELPWQTKGGGISATFTGGIRHTRYWLQQTTLTNSRPTRTTAQASLEVRSNFERISTNRHWRHVISPIIRYDYVNAPNQSLLPNFDSAFGLLTWNNLMSSNRYSGYDRIGNANRFSVMLENRLQNKKGKLTAARDVLIVRAGAAYYLSRKTVDAALQPAPPHPFSNLLGEITWQPVAGITIYGSGQYNSADHYWATLNSSVSLSSRSGNTLSAGYYLTDPRYSYAAKMIYLSGNAHLNSRWKATANWQYNALLKLSQRIALGLQYQHPCWTVGAEAYRINRSTGAGTAANFGFRLLLEFKGLGGTG